MKLALGMIALSLVLLAAGHFWTTRLGAVPKPVVKPTILEFDWEPPRAAPRPPLPRRPSMDRPPQAPPMEDSRIEQPRPWLDGESVLTGAFEAELSPIEGALPERFEASDSGSR